MNVKQFRIPLALVIAPAMVAGLLALAWVSSATPRAAHAQGPCVLGPHSGTISSDESWCLADSPHIVNDTVIVAEGVILTIEPGVVVKFRYQQFNYDRDLIVHGTLDAQGTYTDTIRFTSNHSAPDKGDWGQIYFGDYSTDSVLDYVTVEYGGNGIWDEPNIFANTSSLLIDHSTIRRGSGSGIQLNNVSPTIRNTTFEDNDGSALYLDGGACFPALSNLSATGNGHDAISINGNTYVADYTWGDAGISEYRLLANVTVNQDVTLTVEPGTTIKLWYADLIVNGTLHAQGTVTDIIRFTSDAAAPAKGDWGIISFGDYSTDSVLDYVTVEYGGYGIPDEPLVSAATDSLLIDHSTIRRGRGSGIQLNNVSPTIRNTTFEDNDGSALYLDGGACFPELSNLSATGNGHDAISIKGNTYTANYTWGDAGISEYRLLANVTINQGVTLTVEPGTTVKLWYVDLIVNGTLHAQGLPDQGTVVGSILFTSDSTAPGKGDWGRIYFEPTSTNNILEYVTVEYGGYGIPGSANVSADTNSLTIRHSTIARSYNDGIRLNGGAPTIEYNSIVENDGYGVNNLDGSITAYAQCNWWGHASGPYHATLNPDGLGQKVSDHVVFSPWLTSPDGECTIYRVYLPVTLNNYP